MITSDAANRQLAATSSFRQRPVLEWSKQMSRAASPYFMVQPPLNIRQNYGGENPQRHHLQVLFDKTQGRSTADAPPDNRNYEPATYAELHPHCTVDIKRNLPRSDIFTKQSYGGDTSLDPFVRPGWVKGTRGTFDKAEKSSSWCGRSTPDTSAELHPNASVVLRRAPSVTFGHEERDGPRSKKKDTAEALDVSFTTVSRHCGTLSFSRTSDRHRAQKPSEQYRTLLLNEIQTGSNAPQKARITAGFAPVRHNHRLTLGDLLGQTASDVKRAQSVMNSYFGDRSMSSLRSTHLYTPPPS
ncbi:Hypothetical protein, putative [Bodo saltans]|uniref:Uncharacterized protein n=1 Tax=Bodo saltans TaxID=75058 RepID=A0A0S4KH05_BODSA|nr:Hypothetical protein, putative [Bodo saltans]|eukprot:CUI11051.1 Hypothetical protein, putative [Bodo saltans]